MSDTVGSALIEIQPDFSQFEQELTKGLQAAAQKAQKQANLSLNFDQRQVKTAESGVSSLSVSMDRLAKSVDTMNSSFIRASNSQRNFNRSSRDGSKQVQNQAQAFSSFAARAAIVGSQVAQAGTSVVRLTEDFQGFANLRAKATSFFSNVNEEAEKTPGKLDDVVAAFGRFFAPVEKIEVSTKTIKDANRAITQVETTTVKTAGSLKIIDVAMTDAAGNFTGGTEKIIGGATKAAKATVEGSKSTVQALNQTKKAGQTFGGFFSSIFGRFKSESGSTSLFAGQAFANLGVKIRDLATRSLARLREAFTSGLTSIRGFGTEIRSLFHNLSRFSSVADGFRAKLSEIGDRISSLRERGGPLGQVLGFLGDKLKTLGPAGAAGVAVAGFALVSAAAGKAIISLAQKASNLEESINAVSVTMGDAFPRFKELIGDTSKLGITQLELNESLTPIIPLLQDAGKSGEDLAGGLNELSRRAVDLGSIFNQSTSQVLVKLGAAIRGEIEPARALGVTFNAAAVDAEAAALGFEKVNGQVSEQAKTLARFNLVLEKTRFAAGDYANTSDGLANATRNFQSVIAELGFEFSAVFLPAAEKIRASLNRLATESGPLLSKIFDKLTPAVTQLGEVIADIAVDGLAGSFVDAANIASTTFIPMLQTVVKSVELALNSFEIFNTVMGKILPGELSIATIALTSFLVKLQVTSLLAVVTRGLNGVAAALKAVAAAQAASAAVSKFSAALAGAVNPITAVVTGALLLWQVLGQGESSSEALEKRVRSLADSGFVYLRVRSDEAKKALEEVFGTSVADTLLNSIDKITDAQRRLAEAQEEYNKEVSRSDATDTLALKATGDREKAAKALVDVENDIVSAEETVREAVRQGNIVQARAIVGALEEGDVKDRLNKALREGENLYIADTEASAENARIKEELTAATEDAAGAFQTLFTNLAKSVDLVPQLDSLRVSLTSASEKLNELIKERNQLISNVVAKHLEEFNAVKSIRDIQRQIDDNTRERANLEQQVVDTAARHEEIASRLSEIEERRTGFLNRQVEIQARINELLAPPDPADVQAAQDALTRSQIKQAQLSRKRLDTEEEITDLGRDQSDLQVDLTGLSLDEAKSRLASARAAAAAKRSRQKDSETSKEAAEDELTLEEQRTLLEIDKRDAARDVNQRQEDLNKLLNPEITNREEISRLQEESKNITKDIKGLEKDIEGIEKDRRSINTDIEDIQRRIRRLDEDAPGLILQKKIAEQDYQSLLRGESGITERIKGLNDQIVGQRQSIKDLADQERQTIDKIRLGEEAVTTALRAQNLERAHALGLINDQLSKAQDAVKRQISGVLANQVGNIFSESFLQTDRGQVAADRFLNQVVNNPSVLSAVADALVITPGGDIREILKRVLRELGINIPGFSAEGSVIPGAPGPMGTLMHVGEYGKPEAILPLTKPGRFASVLQQSLPYAHPSIQGMIGRMYQSSILDSLPGISAPLPLRSGKLATGSNATVFHSAKPTPTEQRLDRLIQLMEAMSDSDRSINAPITVNGVSDPDRAARKVVRELEKRLERRR